MTLTLNLDLEEEALLRTEAAKAGMDEASYLHSLIKSAIAPKALHRAVVVPDFGGRSIADIIQEIGTVDGLPADLSTHPKYMEGFGETKNVRDLTK